MFQTHAAVVLMELDSEPALDLVLIAGNDGEEEVIAFTAVTMDGERVLESEPLTRRLVSEEDPRMLRALARFAAMWGLHAGDLVRMFAAYEAYEHLTLDPRLAA
ncbi:hypothetical protein HYS28_01195 [Candidatus Uhrbacteria bacterium]|nr:hypothetical protein [Candidatus Uhrbacteria bacterium]